MRQDKDNMDYDSEISYDSLKAIAAIIGFIGLLISFSLLCLNVAEIRESLEKIESILEEKNSI